MSLILTFFRTLWHSIWDRSFYKDVLKRKSSGASFWYLYWLFVLLLFAQMIPIAITLFTNIDEAETFVEEFKEQSPDFYPEELVITITKDGARTNVYEPYNIAFPTFLSQQIFQIKNMQKEYALTIDTNAFAEDYPQTNALFLLTKHSLIYPDTHGYKVWPLEQLFMRDEMPEEIVIHQKLYRQFVHASFPLANKIPTLLVTLGVLLVTLAPFFVGLFLWFGKLIGLLLPVFLLWFIFAKILKRNITYKPLFRLSLHAITVPVLFKFFLPTFFGAPFFWFPTVYFLVWMWWVVAGVTGKARKR